MEPVTNNFVFNRGYVYKRDRLYFLTFSEELMDEETGDVQDAQVFIFRDGEWVFHDLQWNAIGLTITEQLSQAMIALGREGEVLIGSKSGFSEEEIEDENGGPVERGPMRSISTIDGSVFAVGMNRQIYRWIGANGWDRHEEGLPKEIGLHEIVGFNAIDGSAINDLYVVGWGGEIWRNDGKGWRRIESPTNLALLDVKLINPDLIYACGQGGIIIRGSKDRWELVEYEGPEDLEFSSMAWFKDKLYLADNHALYVLDKNELSKVDFGVDGTVPSSHLHANDGILLSVAGKEVFTTTDGIKWDEVPC